MNSTSHPVQIPDAAAHLPDDWRARVAVGARLIRFEVCFSVVVATVRRESPVALTYSRLDRYLRGLGHTLGSLLLGPWGIPWGPIWTVRAAWVNLTGGTDVTEQLLACTAAETFTQTSRSEPGFPAG
ncbi:MAG: hypothetical protein K2P78_01820 [Gemmataceae bacterium]|nr:hypothetical protein [Gemmataceae bacterium]